MFSWYRELTNRERTTFWGCFAGWAVDAMDAQLFSFVLPVLIATWGITTAQAGYLATATLLSAAIGGWACGFLADRVGRVRIMQFTILWFALFTFIAGFPPWAIQGLWPPVCCVCWRLAPAARTTHTPTRHNNGIYAPIRGKLNGEKGALRVGLTRIPKEIVFRCPISILVSSPQSKPLNISGYVRTQFTIGLPRVKAHATLAVVCCVSTAPN